MTGKKPARPDRGITLVEVLLASVVCGAGISVILSAMSTSIRADVYAENRVKAARLLELTLGRVEGGILPPQAGTGDFSADGEPDFTYSIAVDDGDQPNLQQITIDVQWMESGTPHDVDVVRLIFTDPDAAAAALAASGQAGSLMGSNGSGPSGSLMGSGSNGASGSLMGSGSSGASGSQLGSGSAMGSGGASGSLIGGAGSP